MPKGFRLALLLAALSVCLPVSSFAAPDVQARYEKALMDAQSLTNFEIEFLDTLCLPHGMSPSNQAPFYRTCRYTFTASGPRYHSESTLVSGSQTNLVKHQESAFDGTWYRAYSGNQLYLTRGNSKPSAPAGESPFNPLLAPLAFLEPRSDPGSVRLPHLADIDSSAATYKLVQQSGRSAEGLLNFSMPDFANRNQPSTWTISINENSDSFTPESINSQEPGNKFETVYQLLNYTNFGACQFPTRIEWSMRSSASPSTLVETGTVTLVSVRIPATIPDSAFTMTEIENAAARIWDWDQKKFVDASGNVLKPKATPPRPKIYDESADGSKQIADALAIASKEHKHVLVQFGANWCGWCYKLHDLFATDTHIVEMLKDNYVVVLIDVDKEHNKDTDTKYEHPTRFGLPAIVVLDAGGKQLTTEDTGKLEDGDHHSPEKVIAFLKEWAPKK